jgi:diphosphomevalonate decarboxylase
MQDGMQVLAQAQPNIALVKYWGKRNAALNLPAVGSLSITLDSLWTRTRLSLDSSLGSDEMTLDGRPARPRELERVRALLARLRHLARSTARARVDTTNNFPTAAGLASSASGFAALAVAGSRAYGLALAPTELSRIAREASGSAARSLFGGFVEMEVGAAPDGHDAVARPLLDPSAWPLEVLIAITSTREKEVGSTEGMTHTALTSPYYEAWVTASPADLRAARDAVLARDFEALALVSERSCLRMHALAASADPGLLYWNGATVEALHAVRALRRAGTPCFFTVDAGPQVKVVCPPSAVARVAEVLREVPGVAEVLHSTLGAGARLLEADPALASVPA